MKILIFISGFISLVVLNACNPNAGKDLVTEFVQLKATINNTSETIQLGDTLKISLKLPDTVKSNLRLQAVQSLQRGFYAMSISREDTLNRRGVSIRPPNYWVSKGSTEGNFFFVLKTDAKPYEVVLNIKPPEKGLYLLEVMPQPGVLKINNNYDANLFVDFDVPNKHYSILSIISPYFGGQPFYDAVLQRDAEGFGVYFFRVN